MNKADIGNAVFELGGALLQLMNVRKLLQDRKVQGVYWPVTAFFAVWGVWNLYFYWSLGAPLSVAASGVITAANFWWVALAIRYSRTAKTGAEAACELHQETTGYRVKPCGCWPDLQVRHSDGICGRCGGAW